MSFISKFREQFKAEGRSSPNLTQQYDAAMQLREAILCARSAGDAEVVADLQREYFDITGAFCPYEE